MADEKNRLPFILVGNRETVSEPGTSPKFKTIFKYIYLSANLDFLYISQAKIELHGGFS